MLKKNNNDKVDYKSLNSVLKTSDKIIKIGYIMALIAVILLGTYLIKEWSFFKILKDLIIVISPIFIGFLIAWLFDPLVSTLAKKLPRIVCCILVYIFIIGFLFLILYLFIPSLISQVKEFVVAAPDIFDQLTSFILGIVSKMDTNGFVDIGNLRHEIKAFVSNYGMTIVSDLPTHILNISKGVISGGLNFSLGLMVGFYLLYDFNKVNVSIENILPVRTQEGYHDLMHRINTSLRSYVQGVLMVMILVFITQSIGLTIAGLKAPILFALFCAVTDIIPYFGPYIGGIPAVIVGFTMSPITGICVLISIVIVQLLENNFYQPLIMGHTMKLHPVTIMIGLLIFEHFFGILGMVIATPVIACMKVLILFIDEKYDIRCKIKQENIENKTEIKD